MEPTSKKTKSRPKLNPTESAALQRLEHDLITDSGTVPATKGRHAIHCLTVIGTIEGHTLARMPRKPPSMSTSSRSWWILRRTRRSKACWSF